MKISETMTRDVQLAEPTQTIMEAAQMMADLDVGALPVGENDRLVGIVTDRDIVVRALARGRGPETPIREVMSSEIMYCFDDEAIEDVALNMGDIQVRRLPVLNRDKRLVGIISIADIACDGESRMHSGQALEAISRPGGQHSQSDSRAT